MSSATSSEGEPAPSAAAAPLYSFGEPWPEFNEGLYYTDVFRSSSPGQTLIEFYSSKHKSSAPFQGWLQRIRNGQITIDGEIVTDPDTVVRVGSKMVYHRLPWKELYAPYVLEVLYEDDDMVAINKPSGLQVLPGGLFQQRTVLNQLQRTFQEPHPVPVHRLGRGTSGVLLCAKTMLTKTSFASYFADGTSVAEDTVCRKFKPDVDNVRRISKFYRALVTGIIKDDEIVVNQPIGVMRYPGVAKGLYMASSSGKPSLSEIHVLERDLQGNKTLIQVKIHTGRPHQIRIHLAFIGHPLLGDPLYGIGGCPSFLGSEYVDESYAEDGGYQKPQQPVPGDCGYYLHAHRLVLYHPSTNELIEITAPLPSVLQTRQELD